MSGTDVSMCSSLIDHRLQFAGEFYTFELNRVAVLSTQYTWTNGYSDSSSGSDS